MLKRPISQGTFLLFLFVSIAPLALVAMLILQYAKSEQTNVVHDRLYNSIEQAGVLIEDYLNLDVIKRSQDFAIYFTEISRQNFDADEIHFLARQWLKGSVLNNAFIFRTPAEMTQIDNPDFGINDSDSFIKYINNIADSLGSIDSTQPFIHYFKQDNISCILSAVPYQTHTGETGQIITFAKLYDLHDKFAEISRNKSGSLFLLDGAGEFLCEHVNTRMTTIALDTLKTAISKYYINNKNTFDFGQSIIKLKVENDKTCLALFRKMPKLQKTIVSLSPAISYTSVLKYVYTEMVIALVLALLLAIISNYFAYTRIGRPVHRLIEAANRIAKGDFDFKLSSNYADEIGNLTRVFNQIINQVRTFNQINIDKIIIERKKLEHIIEQMIEGILIVDPENNILMVNKSFADWYGLDKKEVLNKKLSSLSSLSIYYEMIKAIGWEKSTEFQRKKIINTTNNDKLPKVLEATAANIFTSGKTFLATSVYIRDISKEHEVDKLKSELLSIVAHELRSPMVSVIGFSEMLMEEDLDPELREEYLGIIHQESSRLSEFIDQFLDLTRIESGSLPLNCKDDNFTKTVQKVVKLYSSQAINKHIAMHTDFCDPMQVLYYDAVLMERAIGNYLSNAIKYSPAHSKISIRTYREGDTIGLEVADTGLGISKENLPRIFEKFYRVEQSSAVSGVKGSGLGLAFVKQVVEKHSGEVYAKSTLNKGSVFGMTLPLE